MVVLAARQDGRPRHQQVAADIRAQIMSGELAPGAQLPAITQLAERYGTTNTTIQHALADLREEDFVFSQAGKGVFVRDRRLFTVRVGTYFTPTPRGYSYKLVDVAEVRPPAEVAAAYGLGADSTAILRQRLMLHSGEPVELSWSYYPLNIAGGTPLAGRAKIVGGAPQVLAELGYPQLEFTDRISSRPPTTEELEALDLPNDVPVIRQLRIVRSEGGRPVEVGIQVKGAHLYELLYQESITPALEG